MATSKKNSKDFVDDLFGNDTLDDSQREKWNEKTEEARKNAQSGGSMKWVYSYFLKTGQKGLVSFLLPKGLIFRLHRVYDRKRGFYDSLLCKRKDCELCEAGIKASETAIYPVIDWLHTFKTKKDNKIVRKPTLKIFQCGNTSANMIEKMRAKFGTEGLLTGKKWEVDRSGAGPTTVYTIMPDDDCEIDFEETETIQGKDGNIQVPKISVSDWPAYPEDGDSMYSLRKLKPEGEMDWSDPEKVAMWLRFHYLNRPLADYDKYSAHEDDDSSAHDEPASAEAKDDGSIPF